MAYTPASKTSAEGTSNSTSIQRKEAGVDTDDNAADFAAATPSPQGSGNDQVVPAEPTDTAEPSEPSDPAQPAPEPGAITPIAEIQGTGAASPLEGKTVTTEFGYFSPGPTRNPQALEHTPESDDWHGTLQDHLKKAEALMGNGNGRMLN